MRKATLRDFRGLNPKRPRSVLLLLGSLAMQEVQAPCGSHAEEATGGHAERQPARTTCQPGELANLDIQPHPASRCPQPPHPMGPQAGTAQPSPKQTPDPTNCKAKQNNCFTLASVWAICPTVGVTGVPTCPRSANLSLSGSHHPDFFLSLKHVEMALASGLLILVSSLSGGIPYSQSATSVSSGTSRLKGHPSEMLRTT